MANVGYEHYNTSDVATLFGVQKCTVADWCRKGYIKFTDVSGPGSIRPRYLFEENEVERVSRLINTHGKRAWFIYDIDETKEEAPTPEPKNEIYGVTNPEEYVADDIDEIVDLVKKKRALEIQKVKLLAEVDRVTDTIETIKQKLTDKINN